MILLDITSFYNINFCCRLINVIADWLTGHPWNGICLFLIVAQKACYLVSFRVVINIKKVLQSSRHTNKLEALQSQQMFYMLLSDHVLYSLQLNVDLTEIFSSLSRCSELDASIGKWQLWNYFIPARQSDEIFFNITE